MQTAEAEQSAEPQLAESLPVPPRALLRDHHTLRSPDLLRVPTAIQQPLTARRRRVGTVRPSSIHEQQMRLRTHPARRSAHARTTIPEPRSFSSFSSAAADRKAEYTRSDASEDGEETLTTHPFWYPSRPSLHVTRLPTH